MPDTSSGRLLKCDTNLVRFTYRNWKGEVAERFVRPICIHFGSTAWHTDAQWLLNGFDILKGGDRDFAICDISEWRRACDEVPEKETTDTKG